MEVWRLWVLVVSFMVLVQTLGIKCCVRQEREALLNIKTYFLTNYNDTLVEKHLSSWATNPKSDCCTWNRVKCHPSSGRVSKLSFQHLNVRRYDEHPFGKGDPANVSIGFSMFQTFKELTSLNFSQGGFQSLENTAGLYYFGLATPATNSDEAFGPWMLVNRRNRRPRHVHWSDTRHQQQTSDSKLQQQVSGPGPTSEPTAIAQKTRFAPIADAQDLEDGEGSFGQKGHQHPCLLGEAADC
ncbi:hypothetical protein QN277_024406 [Acacia crassicarpa]|nr:hypothetical protein QN277_024406 [Acacia crassicarpa]